MKVTTVYTQDELLTALAGMRTNTTEEVTNSVCARISAWLMRLSESARGDDEQAADALETAALDVRDGEWRRSTSAPQGITTGDAVIVSPDRSVTRE